MSSGVGDVGSPIGRRLIIAAYWTEEVEPFMQWENGNKRWPVAIKGSGAQVSMTPEQADQPGLRDTLRRLGLEEAADWLSIIPPDNPGGYGATRNAR